MRRKSRILPVFLSMIMVTGSFSWSVPKVWAEEFADSAEMNENMVISGISSGDVEDFSETDDSFSGEATFLAGADDTFLSDFAEDDSSSAEDFEESYPVVLEGNPDLQDGFPLLAMDPGTEDLRIIPTDVESPANGCIFVGIKGSYVSEVDKALDKINHIRLEACQEGVLNPRTNQPLTEADYVPIKWSYDLEYIARIRAAESALTSQHMRTNGDNCFALKSPNGIGSYGEVLAWNWSSYMTNGIDQWYGEKTDWVNQTEGAVTDHYTQMIDPKNLYVGLGTFCNYYTHYYNTTAGEFSSFRNMDESRMGMTGKCIQLVEVNKNYLNNISYIEGEKNGETGSDTSLSLITGVAYQYSSYLPIMSAVSWCSTKESVATVSDKGVVHAKTAGETIIQAAVDGIKMAEVTFKVTQNSNPDSYQTSIENASIDGILDKKYTGNEIEQTSLKVILDGVELTPGEDYEIYYSNNINVGTANITIQGIGNYTGTVERTFEILEIFQSTIAVDSGSCGDNAVWTYYSDGTVRISGTGSIRAVVQDDGSCNWNRYYTIDEEQEALGYVKVHTVFIEEGITSIEQRTFTEDSETDSPESIIMADSVTAIGDRAFYNCKNLNYIWIGSGLETVGSFVFSYCPNLKQILVSEENPYFASVDGALYSKSFQTLYRVPHSGLEYLQIPDGVTTLSMDSVGDLEELKVVEIPASVTRIEVYAFDGCNNLGEVIYRGSETEWKNITIENYNDVLLNAAIQFMSVSEKDISTCEIELSAWVFDYDQTEKEPTVTVYDGERELIQDTDFSVSYEDNINAGTATVTVTGIGKYKGTADRYFTINQISIDGIEIKGLKNKVYTGKAITQDFRVFRPRYYVGYPGITSDELYEDLDYSVDYENNVYPGTATVIITGMGNYYGTFYANFEITSEKRQISDCKVVLSEKNYYFSCMPIEPTVTLTDGYQELEEYLDYEVSYKNNINAGIGTVIITGLDTYEGTITEEFTIQRTNIKNVEVDGIRTLYYNGEALTQPLSDLYIGLDGVELSSDDYTIKYSNNVKPGTATMTITGKRNLTGSLKKTYKIQLTPTTYTNVSAKKGILYIISKKISRISGYELQYSTNKKFKSGIKKIRGINNKKSLKISSLKRRTTYYFRIRTYKTISGKTYYSAWSKTGKINIK